MLAQGIKIHFAHRTFSWNSEARGKTVVHCVIVGFGLQDVAGKPFMNTRILMVSRMQLKQIILTLI